MTGVRMRLRSLLRDVDVSVPSITTRMCAKSYLDRINVTKSGPAVVASKANVQRIGGELAMGTCGRTAIDFGLHAVRLVTRRRS